MNWQRSNRKIHYWGSALCAIPILLVILTGLLLMLKKQVPWVQPPTQKATGGIPALAYDGLLESVTALPEMEVTSWDDIDRLDYRPGKGIIKVLAENKWEAQLDHTTGEVLALQYRRSDFIEALHDGSFFSDWVKFGIYFPAALILLVLWITGIYLFVRPLLQKRKRAQKARLK